MHSIAIKLKTMKTHFYKPVLIFFLIKSIFIFAQEKKQNVDVVTSETIYNKLSEAKSGNWKDVLTDFMQLSFKNLAGDSKSFQYKASIFSVMSKADSTLLIDYNYADKKYNFSRNFQIAAGLDLDNDYKFKGFTYGFDWAIVNKRDLSIATIPNRIDKIFIKNQKALMNAVHTYEDLHGDNDIVEVLNTLMSKGQYIPRENLPKEFLELLPESYIEDSKKFEESLKMELDKIKRQPLLTVGFNSNFQKDSKFFDGYNVNMVYLQGLKSKSGGEVEIDFRNQFKVHDSITIDIIKRREFSSQLGLNISILKKKDKSLIEFKPNLEYKRIFSGLMIDEKNNRFLANADLRVRVLKNLWIPLVLKYDLENNNLFGFLNVSFNFDAIKNE